MISLPVDGGIHPAGAGEMIVYAVNVIVRGFCGTTGLGRWLNDWLGTTGRDDVRACSSLDEVELVGIAGIRLATCTVRSGSPSR